MHHSRIEAAGAAGPAATANPRLLARALALSLAAACPVACGAPIDPNGPNGPNGPNASNGLNGPPAEAVTVAQAAPAPAAEELVAPPDPSALAELAEAAAASVPHGGPADRSLAPYFFVDAGDGATDVLPLKQTRAQVRIAGAMADVRVTQVYKNEGRRTLEAIYVFPASTRAAVHGLTMTIGQRVVEAQIRERAQARREYDAARRSGRTASLLEQQRPNVFQTSLANIRPGDEIKVELSYLELLVPSDHVYEFVFPTTVGPRYSHRPEAGAAPQDRFVASPVLQAGAPAAHTFALDAEVDAAVPIRRIECPSHAQAAIDRPRPDSARVKLAEGDDVGNRDFVLRYGLEGDAIDGGLLLEPGAQENHFLLMMAPPARVDTQDIVPREYLFVIDVSGSMHGFPLETAKHLMSHLLGGLRPEDRFDVLAFSGGDALLAPSSISATPDNLRRAMRFTERWTGGGGTELLPALKRTLALPRQSGASRTVVVITDGYVDVEKETFELIRGALGEANLFAFGIGSSVNRFLIEGMARAGQGEPFVALNAAEAEKRAAEFQAYIRAPVLTGVRARIEGLDAYDLEPPGLPDLFAERPVVLVGKYRGAPSGRVVVTGTSAAGHFEKSIDVQQARVQAGGALGLLWARARIGRLTDLDGAGQQSHQAEITTLGLGYHLLTQHTSFVAVDHLVRGPGTGAATVQQPSPMPAGVENSAVGLEQAQRAGVLGVLAPSPATKALSHHSAPVHDPLAATDESGGVFGGLVGTDVGDSYGAAGLGITGAGGGGGGTGEGTIGLGNFGTLGRGAGGTGSGYGRGSGGLHARAEEGHMGKGDNTPDVVTTPAMPKPPVGAAPTVYGSLDKEVIQRVIRAHMNEIRVAYRSALATHPGLRGSVTVRFVIGANGRVTLATIQSSTLGLLPLENAIAAAVRTWVFPAPAGGGVVTVSYPFAFAP